MIDGQPRAFRETISYVSGDNVGSKFMGVFKEGSQAHRKCRECMGISEDICTHVCTTWVCNYTL